MAKAEKVDTTEKRVAELELKLRQAEETIAALRTLIKQGK